jgi:bacterial/archaeal transporter family-2 protein
VSWAWIPVALAAGALAPLQFAVNAQLRAAVGGPVVAAAISFAVGVLVLAVAVLLSGESLPSGASVSAVPWWGWTGGLLGAGYVVASIVLTPRLGAAATIALIVAGQVAAGLVIDHLGALGVPVHHIGLPRIAGAGLIVVGVAVVQRF